jgi:Phytanoyl-CoA dioxygenase (PhyH)
LRLAASDFAEDGIGVCRAMVTPSIVVELRGLVGFQPAGRPGARAFGLPAQVARLVEPGGLLADVANALTGAKARAVRVLYFDKTPELNWAVPWHQDRTIAVADRIEMPGFGPWSVKAGVHHVEPPESILQGLLSLRLHLDGCDADNGPLMALRGSFRLGRVPAEQIKRHVAHGPIQVCCAKGGDIVAMRGLTIHASERASRPGHRRVLHVDFSGTDLPDGLRWAL